LSWKFKVHSQSVVNYSMTNNVTMATNCGCHASSLEKIAQTFDESSIFLLKRFYLCCWGSWKGSRPL